MRAAATANATRLAVQQRSEAQQQQQRETREAAVQRREEQKAEKQRQNSEAKEQMMRQQPAYIEAERSTMEDRGCRCLWSLSIPNQCKKNKRFALHRGLAEHLRVKHNGKNGPVQLLFAQLQAKHPTRPSGLVGATMKLNGKRGCLQQVFPAKNAIN